MSGKYIVVFKDGTTDAQVQEYASQVNNNGGKIHREPILPPAHVFHPVLAVWRLHPIIRRSLLDPWSLPSTYS
ncbi:hypothetical protein AX16_006188 [Volvariella volvacea WC 439]|nr:hypothetical protein AX16_006188 [Volvariella volvacea WC 439]